jgi:nucleoside-diphosphate-sugar epimerase
LGHATCLVNPISVVDVAALMPRLIANGAYFARRQVPIGGPDVYSWSALADVAADIVGRRRRHTADVGFFFRLFDSGCLVDKTLF